MKLPLPLAGTLLLSAGLVCGDAARPGAPSGRRQQLEAARTPSGFVYVAGGDCWLGSDDADAEECDRPLRREFIPSFYIGRTEVSRAEWQRFRPDHRIPAGAERHPITNLLLEDAQAYCRWVGGRLPSDAEWEKAARGTDARRYPWGNDFEPGRANIRSSRPRAVDRCAVPGIRRGLSAVDEYPASASPYGAINMAGNAWEWVSTAYGGDASRRIIRGGATGYGERAARTYQRGIEGAGVT